MDMSKQEKKPASPSKKKQNRVVLLSVAILALVVAAVNIRGLVNSYYDSFILRGSQADEAASYLKGLEEDGLTEKERGELVRLREDWDSWRYSRLRDEVTTTAADGVTLHGYFYDEGSDVTALFVPRFHQDGTGDFLLGPWLSGQTGCNILVIDPRAHGGSGGAYYSYGYRESEDLVCWMDWADETLGKQTFILCGEASGANTILFAAARGELDGRAAFAVAESPFASFRDLAVYTLKHSYKLPAFPFLNLMEWKLNRAGFGSRAEDMELSAALEGADFSLPVLLLSSGDDAYVPPEMTEKVAALLPDAQSVSTSGPHCSLCPGVMEGVEERLAEWVELYLD